MVMLIAGMDPGRGGKTKRELDTHALARLIGDRRPGHAFVELVGAMPGQGVSSVFAFGKSFGVVIGVPAALGIPFTLISPQVWKGALGVSAGKDGARARASQLMPAAAHHWTRVRDDERAGKRVDRHVRIASARSGIAA
jgi:crossover junction endodeoxyribonuclease RuvC